MFENARRKKEYAVKKNARRKKEYAVKRDGMKTEMGGMEKWDLDCLNRIAR